MRVVVNPAQREEGLRAALATVMREVSQDWYAAGWLMGLEHELWTEVLAWRDGTSQAARPEAHEDVVGAVRALSVLAEEVDGWFTWDDDAGHEAFVRAEEWERRYQPGRGRFFR